VQSKAGLLEIAHKGTVFFGRDRGCGFAAATPSAESLEEKQFRRLGDIRDRRVDVRLIAATTRTSSSSFVKSSFVVIFTSALIQFL